MIVLKRKRIVIISIFCMLSIFSLMLVSNLFESREKIKNIKEDDKANEIEKEKTVETVSLPSTNKVIVLDAGHGKPDERSRE